MTSSDVLAYVRQLLSDTNSSGRWTDSTLLNFIDRSNKRVVREVLFPDSRIIQPTVGGVQEYQFPIMIKVFAVYVAGQACAPSDVATLEGRQIGNYGGADNPDGVVQTNYGGGPVNALGPNAPQWVTAGPATYPSGGGYDMAPAPDAQPYWIGQYPRFYWRGGWLGLVPAPANTTPVTITVDGVRQPDTILGPNQLLSTPENFMDAIAWDAVSQAMFADDSQQAAAQMQAAKSMYSDEIRALRLWRGEYRGEQRNGPKMITQRSLASNARRRRGYCPW